MPRFVIQQHDKQGEEIHWDLMLEEGEILKTFRLDTPPHQLLTKTATATAIFDHDPRFLTYEGTVNQGLGNVTIQEQGSYETISHSDGTWLLEFHGKVLYGPFGLRPGPGDSLIFGKETM